MISALSARKWRLFDEASLNIVNPHFLGSFVRKGAGEIVLFF